MANPGERIMRASCNEDSVVVELADGRTLSAPLAWYPPLLHSTPQQRSSCVIAGEGMVFIGRRSTRISASKACYGEPQRHAFRPRPAN